MKVRCERCAQPYRALFQHILKKKWQFALHPVFAITNVFNIYIFEREFSYISSVLKVFTTARRKLRDMELKWKVFSSEVYTCLPACKCMPVHGHTLLPNSCPHLYPQCLTWSFSATWEVIILGMKSFCGVPLTVILSTFASSLHHSQSTQWWETNSWKTDKQTDRQTDRQTDWQTVTVWFCLLLAASCPHTH